MSTGRCPVNLAIGLALTLAWGYVFLRFIAPKVDERAGILIFLPGLLVTACVLNSKAAGIYWSIIKAVPYLGMTDHKHLGHIFFGVLATFTGAVVVGGVLRLRERAASTELVNAEIVPELLDPHEDDRQGGDTHRDHGSPARHP